MLKKDIFTRGVLFAAVNQATAKLVEFATTFGPLTGHPFIFHPSW